jgi:hypothetical protein
MAVSVTSSAARLAAVVQVLLCGGLNDAVQLLGSDFISVHLHTHNTHAHTE